MQISNKHNRIPSFRILCPKSFVTSYMKWTIPPATNFAHIFLAFPPTTTTNPTPYIPPHGGRENCSRTARACTRENCSRTARACMRENCSRTARACTRCQRAKRHFDSDQGIRAKPRRQGRGNGHTSSESRLRKNTSAARHDWTHTFRGLEMKLLEPNSPSCTEGHPSLPQTQSDTP